MSGPDKRHGGPYDRGSADAYYGRSHRPHYFAGPTGHTPRIEEADMTPEQIAEYNAGFSEEPDQKEWR
jgi:hypothetical protein